MKNEIVPSIVLDDIKQLIKTSKRQLKLLEKLYKFMQQIQATSFDLEQKAVKYESEIEDVILEYVE